MTTRPSMPPEVQAAYDRGEVVSWSPVRGTWMVAGRRYTGTEGRAEGRGIAASAMRAVVAALEERRVRPVGQRAAREVPERCPRCGGSVIAERDEDGDLDAYCIACGRRTGAPTAEEAEALRRELHEADFVTVKRSNGPRRKGMVL